MENRGGGGPRQSRETQGATITAWSGPKTEFRIVIGGVGWGGKRARMVL